jgi:hypothetical protein
MRASDQERQSVDGGRHEIVADLGLLPPSDLPEPPRAGDSTEPINVAQSGRARQTWRRLASTKVSVPVLLAVLLVGVASTAAITSRGISQQQLRLDESRVFLTILADATSPVGMNQDDENRLRLGLRLNIVNSGPRSVGVSELRGTKDGLTLRGQIPPVEVKAGATQQVTVTVTVDCLAGMPRLPVPIELAVRTVNGQTHQASYLVALAGTQADDLASTVCMLKDRRIITSNVPAEISGAN